MIDLNDAKAAEAEALERLAKAQEDYEKALRDGSDAEAEAARVARDSAQENADAASENTRKQEETVNRNREAVTDTASALSANMENVTQGLQKLASAGIKNAYDGLIQLGKGVGGSMGKLAESLEKVPIVGWIISIIDVFKDGLSDFIGPLLDSVFNAVSGILDDILSGDVFVTLFKSIRSGIGNILNAISFGGFGKLVDKINGSNAKEVQASIDRLTDRNESLQQSIEDLTDTIKGGEGTKSVSAYQQAYDYQAETNRNYLDIAKAQAGYHGSHHSWNYYWGGFSQEQIDKLSQQIGRDWNGDLWDLSPDEMKILRSNVDMWKQIQDTGKGGYGGRLTEKLDDYIDQAGKLEELEEQLNESLTQISFDSLYDSFIDTLMDMDASAEEIAGNVGEYFMRAILSNQIGEKYKERLQAWYDDFADAMKDNELSQDEIGSLTDSYRDIVEEAVALRDKLAEATGYTGDSEGTTQSGKSGSFNAMSQEQGTKLEGMFTSGLMHWASMDEQMQEVSAQMGTAVDHLRRIEENTGNSAKHLGEIKEDIKKIIRDGLKMK